jgi:YD repeat-containing protein
MRLTGDAPVRDFGVRRVVVAALSLAVVATLVTVLPPLVRPVSASGPPTSVSLGSSAASFAAGSAVTLTATTDTDPVGAGYHTVIEDMTVGVALVDCTASATTCVATGVKFSSGPPHDYVAFVYPTGTTAHALLTSSVVTVSRAAWAASLSSSVQQLGVSQSGTLTASANQEVGSTGGAYVLTIVDQTSGVTMATCAVDAGCTASIQIPNGLPQTYVAMVADRLGRDVQATSTPVVVGRSAWTVALSASPTTWGAGQSSTLTATANQDVGSTGGAYVLRIVDETTSTVVHTCSTGVTCTASASFPTGGPHGYYAEVSDSAGGSLQAVSAPLSSGSAGWVVALSVDKPVFAMADSYTLTASTNRPVDGTGFDIVIVDSTTGAVVATCGQGSTCTNVNSFLSGGPHTYLAYVAAVGVTNVQATSNPVVTTRAPWTVTLSADTTDFVTGQQVTLTATANQPGGSGHYGVRIYDMGPAGGTPNYPGPCVYNGLLCSIQASFLYGGAHEYQAQITDANGNDVQAVSNPVYVQRHQWRVSLVVGPTFATAYMNQVENNGSPYLTTVYSYNSDGSFAGTLGTCKPNTLICQINGTTYANRTYVAFVINGPGTDEQASSLGYSAATGYGAPTLDPTKAKNPASNTPSCACSDPVDPGSGDFWQSVTDLALPGRIPVAAARQYDSLSPTVSGVFGWGWSSLLDMTVTVPTQPSTAPATVRQEDGSLASFDVSPGVGQAGRFTPQPGMFATLTRASNGTWLFTWRAGLVYTFSNTAIPRLSSISDRNGDTLAVSYPNGSTTVITTPDGRTLTYTVAGGHVTAVAGPDGRSVGYAYDTSGNLTTVTDSRGKVWRYGYDANHRMTSLQSPVEYAAGVSVTNVFDPVSGRITSQTIPRYPGGQPTAVAGTTTYAYSGSYAQFVTTVTDPDSVVTVYAHVNGQIVTRTVNPDATGGLPASTWTYSYDANGNRVETIDPTNVITTASYDAWGNALTQTDPAGNVRTSTYNAFNEPLTTTVSDAAGAHTTSFAYDTRGNLTSRTVPLDSTASALTTFAHTDANHPGDLTATTDPRNRITQLTYSPEGFLASTTAPDTGKTTYSYNAYGQVLTTVTPLGYVSPNTPAQYTTTSTYDGGGLLKTVTDPNGNQTQYGYDDDDRRTTRTDASDKTWTTSYNPDATIKAAVDPDGDSTVDTYDLAGRLVTKTAADGGVTTYSYDVSGWMNAVIDPIGSAGNAATKTAHTETIIRDGDGRTVSTAVPDPNNPGQLLTTSHVYDFAGRPWKVTNPNGETTTTGYGPIDRVTSRTDGNGEQTNYSYDYAGRLTSVTDPSGHALSYTYDAANNLLSEKDSLGDTTSYGYDPNGRRTSVVDPRGNVAGCGCAATYTTTIAFDVNGSRTSVTDADGHTTRYTYDPAGRLTSVTNPRLETTGYGYDSDDRLITVTTSDSAGTGLAVTTYGYDAAGRRISWQTPRMHGTGIKTSYGYDRVGRLDLVTDQDGFTRTMSYDVDGNVLTAVTARGTADVNHALGTISYGHDPLNRCTSISYGDGAATTTFSYDRASRRVSMVDGAGVQTYSYDGDGRIVSITRGAGRWVYSYYPNGQTQTITRPDASTETWTYDAAGRASRVVNPDGTTVFGYDPAGDLLSSVMPNGSIESMLWDPTRVLSGISTRSGATVLTSQTVIRDGDGNPTQVVVTRNGVSETRSYLYDARDRLAAVCYLVLSSCTTAAAAQAWTYDVDGDRVSEKNGTGAGTVTSYGYDNADRMITCRVGAAGVVTLSYDQDGNVLTDGVSTFSYDLNNRVKTQVAAGKTNTWTRDGDGNVLTHTSTGSASITYSWDLNQAVPRLADTTAGSVSTDYRYDQVGQLIGVKSGSTVESAATDPLGQLTDLIGSTGVIVRSYDYSPFGIARTPVGGPGTPTGPGSALRFGGLVSTYLSGDVVSRDRLEDPVLGVWTGVDPLDPLDGSASGYPYTGQRPTVFTDLSGDRPQPTTTGLVGDGPGYATAQAADAARYDGGWWADLAMRLAPPGSLAEAEGDGVTGFEDGFTNLLTFGHGTNWVRDHLGSAFTVDECSQSYQADDIVGLVTALVFATLASGGVDTIEATANAGLSAADQSALDYATTSSKLDHIFAAKHDFDPLVQQYGSREAVVQQVLNGLKGLTPESGTFEQQIVVGGQKVIVRGAVVDGVTKIGTAFTP